MLIREHGQLVLGDDCSPCEIGWAARRAGDGGCGCRGTREGSGVRRVATHLPPPPRPAPALDGRRAARWQQPRHSRHARRGRMALRWQSSASNRRPKRLGSVRCRRKIWTDDLVSMNSTWPSTTSSSSITFTSRAVNLTRAEPLHSPKTARLARPPTHSSGVGLAKAVSNCAGHARTADRS